MTVSIPTSFWIRIADGSTPMRLWARGPSGTFTASTPAALSARHCSSIGVGSTPLGGGGGAAAPPHGARARLDHAARVTRHVFRRREVDLPVAHVFGQAGIRDGGDRAIGGLHQPLHGFEHAGGTHGAVYPHGVRAP